MTRRHPQFAQAIIGVRLQIASSTYPAIPRKDIAARNGERTRPVSVRRINDRAYPTGHRSLMIGHTSITDTTGHQAVQDANDRKGDIWHSRMSVAVAD
ncbi:hypothetical protein PX699_29105 [Sphingobium sp. H39-3-25]|uniref:hypothetical protein n=1 Tax=Sphingobium arseniciresistens TaxID=3030834 RepID=UPI0023BA3996|nr:hypothetical protein [Sphingobium arseniciresistens]